MRYVIILNIITVTLSGRNWSQCAVPRVLYGRVIMWTVSFWIKKSVIREYV